MSLPKVHPADSPHSSPCPACDRPLDTDSVICVNCGYDKRKGFTPGTGLGASAQKSGSLTCNHCGYDLRGLKLRRCPECGKVPSAQHWRDWNKALGRDVVRKAWLVPGAIFAVCVLGTIAGLLLTGNARSVLPFSVFMGVYVLAGLIANFILCAVWSGFDAPMSLTALRLGAVGSLYIALQLLTAAVLPPSILLLIIPIMSATVLALVLLDLEPVEALVLTILTGAIAFGLVQALISLGLRSL